MKKWIKIIQFNLLTIGLWALPLATKAALPISNPAPGILPDRGDAFAVIRWIINILLTLAGLIAVLFIIIGGFQYITSAANAEQAETAKKTIQNAIIGLIIIILSFVIVNIINTTLARVNNV